MPRWDCWTSIMAANTCGIWDERYTAKGNPNSRNGSNPYGTGCDTERSDKRCARLLILRNAVEKPAR